MDFPVLVEVIYTSGEKVIVHCYSWSELDDFSNNSSIKSWAIIG